MKKKSNPAAILRYVLLEKAKLRKIIADAEDGMGDLDQIENNARRLIAKDEASKPRQIVEDIVLILALPEFINGIEEMDLFDRLLKMGILKDGQQASFKKSVGAALNNNDIEKKLTRRVINGKTIINLASRSAVEA